MTTVATQPGASGTGQGDEPPPPPPPRPAQVFDPTFAQFDVPGKGTDVPTYTVRSSALVCLTQDPKAPLGRTLKVDKYADLDLCGDEVRVCGPVEAAGRSISIACRVLTFAPDSSGAPASISTDGALGENATTLTTGKATNGAAGTHSGSPLKAGATHAAGGNGAKGNATQDGGHGAAAAGTDGGAGGTISIACDQLVLECDTALSANGGNGGNGANGQDGGDGGNGVSGLTVLQILNDINGSPNVHYDTSGPVTNTTPPEQATGGAGGGGGDGGKGGNGGAGGAVNVKCLDLQSAKGDSGRFSMKVSAGGGNGGNGGHLGFGGNGGPGGDAGMDSCAYAWYRGSGPHLQQYSSGGAGGNAGARGAAGVGGTFGSPGTATFHVPHGSVAAGVTVTLKPGANGTAGGVPAATDGTRKDGQGGGGGKRAEATNPPDYDDDEASPYGSKGADGNTPTPPTSAPPAPPAPPAASTPTFQTTSYAELAPYFPVDQLRMSLERIRTHYVLTNVPADVAGVNTIRSTLDWLKHILAITTAGDPDGALRESLRSAATGLATKLRRGRNAFGEGDTFGALGKLDTYRSALDEMVDALVLIEANYRTDVAALVGADARTNYLQTVQEKQNTALNDITADNAATENATADALSRLDVLSRKCEKAADDLQRSMQAFEDKIEHSGPGLTISGIVSLLTNLSFADGSRPLQAGMMAAGQVVDISNQAINDVATDSGGTESRQFVIQRMMSLSADVKSFTGLSQAADGFLTSKADDLALLVSTRDQVDGICEDFYDSIPEAGAVSELISAYIDLTSGLNATIEEFNSLVTDLFEGRAELDKVTAQSKRTGELLEASAQPDLPAMASFATALYTRTRAECIRQLYMASRAYTLQALDGYDVFEDMLGQLLPAGAEPDDLDSTALKGTQIALADKRLSQIQKTTSAPEPFIADGDRCRVVLTPETEPLLFAMLKAGKTGSFTLAPALPGDDIDANPFAGKRNVRLTAIRALADGLVTTDAIHHIELTHSGVDHFVRPDGREVVLVHGALTIACEYDTVTNKWIEGNDGALDPEYQMIGPFTEWLVTLDYNKLNKKSDGTPDLDGLTSLTVEFDGCCQSPAIHTGGHHRAAATTAPSR